MSDCHHPAWLQLSGSPEAFIHDEDQLQRILHGLADPAGQKPSLILFVGPREKEHALRDIFPFNNFSRNTKRHSGTVNIRIDTTTSRSGYPVLFADSDPFCPSSDTLSPSHCHEISSHLTAWKATSHENLYDIVHARLLALFADVICFLCKDSWGEDKVVERLHSWVAANDPSEVPTLIRPRVIIVVKGDDASPTYNILQLEDLRFSLRHEVLRGRFSSITILRLADERVSSLSRHRRLKELIFQNLDEMRYLRRSLRYLFSASHFGSLFQAAIRHLIITKTEPFDALIASRAQNHIGRRLHVHVLTFFQACSRYGIPQATALSIIASSVLMDAYPPRMHRLSSTNITAPSWTNDIRFRAADALYEALPTSVPASA